ncbi:MAG: AI-2E family transporter [Bacteroidota bacterium]
MKENGYDPIVKFFISALGLIAIFAVLKELQHIFIPFLLAYFLFFVFQPFNKFCERKKIAQFITIIIDLLIVIVVIWGLSRIILASFNQFERALPAYETKLNNMIINTAHTLGISDPIITNFNLLEYLNQTLDFGGLAGGFFSSTLTFFSTIFFVLFFFIFISGGHHKIVAAIKSRYMNNPQDQNSAENLNDAKSGEREEQRGVVIDRAISTIPQKIQRYVVTKFIISLITSCAVGIVLWIFGVDFLIVWIVLTFLLNFIPNIGSVIAVILPALVALVEFESFGYALFLVIILSVVQNLMGNVLEPKIIGDKLGLNPLVILLSLLLWGYVWGIVGMFLSVPLTAVIKIIVTESDSPNLKFINNLMG